MDPAMNLIRRDQAALLRLAIFALVDVPVRVTQAGTIVLDPRARLKYWRALQGIFGLGGPPNGVLRFRVNGKRRRRRHKFIDLDRHVAHLDHIQFFHAARCAQGHRVAGPRFHE